MIKCRKCGYERFARNKKDNKEICLKYNTLEKRYGMKSKNKLCVCDLADK